MNDLQQSPPLDVPVRHSALNAEPLPAAEWTPPVESVEEYDKYDISRMACTE